MLNIDLKNFKRNHKRKKNQVIYIQQKNNNDIFIENLINNFFIVKNSFIFESIEKGKFKGRYTIFGKNPDKIWEFNNNRCYLYNKNIKKKLNGKALEVIEKIIEQFKFEVPKELPNICSLISGYFSYDIIKYVENIGNKCIDDLNLPDARILRPKELIIHDNIKKITFYIYNCYSDEIIYNYKKKYNEIKKAIEYNLFISNYENKTITTKVKITKHSKFSFII